MATLSAHVRRHARLSEADIAWLEWLATDWQLLADLDCADVVLWTPLPDGRYVAALQSRPSSAPTLFYRDLIGQHLREQWITEVERALRERRTVQSSEPDWFDEIPTQLTVTPVVRPRGAGQGDEEAERDAATPIAVITRHTNLATGRGMTRQEMTFRECAADLFHMVEAGAFPDPDVPPVQRRGMPRASDGLIRLNGDGVVTFASANALSALNRLGFGGELEGESLVEVVSSLARTAGTRGADEATPVVVGGRAAWTTDLHARYITVTMRSIPLRDGGLRVGAIVLCRDTSDVRHQEQEIITRDATIREIHHRVKNNLQTVAALLRIQARRTQTDESRESLTQAMRRVSSIAVVHDTLAGGFRQTVEFDEVLSRVIKLITEVTAVNNARVRPRLEGSFGTLPSEYATPLALALTELVTNAVEHGLDGRDGEVVIRAERRDDALHVTVSDTGVGFAPGRIGSGLGTQIIRTLVEGELGGSIDWQSEPGAGTVVHLTIPDRWRVSAAGGDAAAG